VNKKLLLRNLSFHGGEDSVRFRVVTSCIAVTKYQLFRSPYRQISMSVFPIASHFALKIVPARISVTMVTYQNTTRHGVTTQNNWKNIPVVAKIVCLSLLTSTSCTADSVICDSSLWPWKAETEVLLLDFIQWNVFL